MIYIFLAFAVAFCLYVSLGPKLTNMNEGMWEITMETKMPGTALGIPFNQSKCLTKTDPLPDVSLPGYECRRMRKRHVLHVIGNYVLWSVHCEGQGVIQGSGHIRFKGDTLKGNIQMRTIQENQERFKVHITGFRTGDCK